MIWVIVYLFVVGFTIIAYCKAAARLNHEWE